MYKPTIRAVDLWHGVVDQVGSLKHCYLIDLIEYGIRGPEDEELLLLAKGGEKGNGHTEDEIGEVLGVSQQAISYRLQRILERARDGTLSRAGGRRRGTDVSSVLPEVRNPRPRSGAADQAA